MNLLTTILTLIYLIVNTFASGTGEAALRGFEQSESDDAELAHSIQVRGAHIPRFIGKRTLDDEVQNYVEKQEGENIDEENLENILKYLLKNYYSEDFNSQSEDDSNSDLTTFERDAKWAPRFVGKRRTPMFVGRRRAPLFVGKRYKPRFVGKRGAPMFVGRRGSPMFVGRRDSPLFIGRRQNALPADTSYLIGGKRSVIAASEAKYPQDSAKFQLNNNELKNKRDGERFILIQKKMFLNDKPVYSQFSKRFVVPEFIGKRTGLRNNLPEFIVPEFIGKRNRLRDTMPDFLVPEFLGKRQGLGSNMQYSILEKRFDTPFFVGRRGAEFPLESFEESNPGLRYAAQEPVTHSDNNRRILNSANGRT